MNKGYVKLFSDILISSIWQQKDSVRIVWITLLALADREGIVGGSLPGVASIARVSLSDCEAALELLQQPDSYSRSEEYDGRRIEKIERGWRILNYSVFREKLSREDRREYNRRWMRHYRAKMKDTRSESERNIRV